MSADASAASFGGRREATKRANRQAILDAGRAVFSTVGFDAATVRDVVRESGLSPGTFYNYFPDKDSVFRVLVGDFLAALRPAVREARAAAETPEAFVEGAFRVVVEALYGDPAMLALIGRSSSAFRAHVLGGAELPGLFAELRDDMGAAVERGLLPAFDVELMTAAMIGAALEVCILAAASGRAPDEVATFLGQLFLAALRP